MPSDSTSPPADVRLPATRPAGDVTPIVKIKPRDGILAEGSNTVEGGATTPDPTPAPPPAPRTGS